MAMIFHDYYSDLLSLGSEIFHVLPACIPKQLRREGNFAYERKCEELADWLSVRRPLKGNLLDQLGVIKLPVSQYKERCCRWYSCCSHSHRVNGALPAGRVPVNVATNYSLYVMNQKEPVRSPMRPCRDNRSFPASQTGSCPPLLPRKLN